MHSIDLERWISQENNIVPSYGVVLGNYTHLFKNYLLISLPKEYAKEGWPILIPDVDEEWHFVKNIPTKDVDPYQRFFVQCNKRLALGSLIFPLNQYNAGIENEEIYNYIKEFKEIIKQPPF